MTDLISRLNKAKGSETLRWCPLLRGVLLGMNNAEDICVEATKVVADQAAEIERLRESAERWEALMSSERIRVMGSAGFKFDGDTVTPKAAPDDWLHFGLEVWNRHPASNEEYPQTTCRNLLITYVDHLRAALEAGA